MPHKMAASLHRWSGLLYFVTLFVTLVEVKCVVEKLQPDQILERIEEGCVFLLISPSDEVLWNNFVTLSVAFGGTVDQGAGSAKEDKHAPLGKLGMDSNNDNLMVRRRTTNVTREVFVGYHDGLFSWKHGEPLVFKSSVQGQTSAPVATAFDTGDVDIVFFPKRKKDRTCLIDMPQGKPKAEKYEGENDVESMVHFLNSRCNSFRTPEGTLSRAGQLRKNILENFFHVGQISNYTMKSYWNERNHARPISDRAIISDDEYCVKKSDGKFSCENNWRDDKLVVSDGSLAQCERITHSMSKTEFFNNYLSRSKPFVLEDEATHWPAFSKWTKEYLRSKYGEREIHIKLAPDGVFEGVEDVSLWENHQSFQIPPQVYNQLLFPDLVVVRPGTANLKFSEFSDMMDSLNFEEHCPKESQGSNSSRVSAYLEYSSIRKDFPELEDDLQELEVVAGLLEIAHLNIWLSDGNTLGKLHFDPFDNFLCQIRGKKQLTLFEPHKNTQLYEAHIPEALLGYNKYSKTFRRKTLLDSTSMVMAPVDITDPDFERFPEFAKTRPMNCTIDEGDVLFMPAFWWHEVQSFPNVTEGRNLAINYWYDPFLQKEFPCQECELDVNPKYRHLLRRFS